MSLYDRLAATPEGERGLAAARLRRWVYHLAYTAASGRTDAEMRQLSGLPKRTVRKLLHGDSDLGDLTVNELAAWLWAGSYEADIKLVRAGQPRADVLAKRAEAADVEQLRRERDDALDRIDYVRHEIEGWNSRDHHLWRAVREALGDPTWTGDPRPMPTGKPRPKELGQKSPEGVVRPPLVTVQQETPPPPSAPREDR